MVQEQVAELEAKLAKLTAEFNTANRDKQEVCIVPVKKHAVCLLLISKAFCFTGVGM